jgi:hypothetical protein
MKWTCTRRIRSRRAIIRKADDAYLGMLNARAMSRSWLTWPRLRMLKASACDARARQGEANGMNVNETVAGTAISAKTGWKSDSGQEAG